MAEKSRELGYLELSIGRTGKMAMLPPLSWRRRDRWQIHMLGGRTAADRR